jgi:hypothetical protein
MYLFKTHARPPLLDCRLGRFTSVSCVETLRACLLVCKRLHQQQPTTATPQTTLLPNTTAVLVPVVVVVVVVVVVCLFCDVLFLSLFFWF